jgi:hypothetical protein
MNDKFYNCVKKLHATELFLTQMREKMNRYAFFNAFGPIQKSHIL